MGEHFPWLALDQSKLVMREMNIEWIQPMFNVLSG